MSTIDSCFGHASYELWFVIEGYTDGGAHGVAHICGTDRPDEVMDIQLRIRHSEPATAVESNSLKTLEVLGLQHTFEGERRHLADALLYAVPHRLMQSVPALYIRSAMPCVTVPVEVRKLLDPKVGDSLPTGPTGEGYITPIMATAMEDFLHHSRVSLTARNPICIPA